MSRRNARENVYKLTFEYLFSCKKNDVTLDLLLMDANLSDDDKLYLKTAYEGIIDHFDELKMLVQKYAVGYAVDRIYKPDLAALIVSAYELKYMPEIPVAVSISSAVEIVKRYSGEKSNSFVNGILGSIDKENRHAD